MRPERRLKQLTQGARGAYASALAAGVVAALLAVVQAGWLARILARAFLEQPAWTDLSKELVAFAGVVCARALCTWAARVLAQRLASRVKCSLHDALHAKLLELGPTFARDERSGELVTTATEGLEQIDPFFIRVLPQRIIAGLIPLVVVGAVAFHDRASGVLLALTAPLVPGFMVLIGLRAKVLSEAQWVELRRMGAHFLDVIQGLPTLKLLGRSRHQLEVIRRMTERFGTTTMSVLKVAFLSAFVLELLATLSTALLAVTLGVKLVSGTMTFEVAIFVLLLAPEVFAPLRALGAQHHAGMVAATAAERIFAILDAPKTQPAPVLPQPVPARMHLQFKDVSYRYADRSLPVLERFELAIRPGERVALVGPSGVGKSTVLELLLGFRTPTEGGIFVDGIPLGALAPEAWRKQVSWVSQRPSLFNATLRDNLRIAKPDASDAELRHVLGEVQLGLFLERLPRGLDTLLGEEGMKLSGGQSQRVALARALIQDTPLVLLDEPTSQLDAVTERAVHQGMDRLLGRHRAVLWVTHRTAALRWVHRVVEMEGSVPARPSWQRVEARGTLS